MTDKNVVNIMNKKLLFAKRDFINNLSILREIA